MELAGVKYLYTDASSPAHVVMNGYAQGSFTFSVNELQGDTPVASATFKDIPTSPQTKVTIDTISDISTLSPMHIDLNGDGVVDYNVAPKPNDTVTLDTTPPEIQLTFSTSTNALVFTATDDSGSATVTASTSYPMLKKNQKGTSTTTLTALDTTGNTTILTLTQPFPQKERRINISVLSVSYNGVVTNIASTTAKYKWNQKTDSTYKLFASFIQTPSTSTESHFRPKKNLTIIMTKPTDFDDTDDDGDADVRPTRQKLPGLIIPSLITQKGSVYVSN